MLPVPLVLMLQPGTIYVPIFRELPLICVMLYLHAVARRIRITFVDPAGLSAFVSCHLITLDKCPGVRVGETVSLYNC